MMMKMVMTVMMTRQTKRFDKRGIWRRRNYISDRNMWIYYMRIYYRICKSARHRGRHGPLRSQHCAAATGGKRYVQRCPAPRCCGWLPSCGARPQNTCFLQIGAEGILPIYGPEAGIHLPLLLLQTPLHVWCGAQSPGVQSQLGDRPIHRMSQKLRLRCYTPHDMSEYTPYTVQGTVL